MGSTGSGEAARKWAVRDELGVAQAGTRATTARATTHMTSLFLPVAQERRWRSNPERSHNENLREVSANSYASI